ncbi:SDR family oxidoreductase [Schaalia sp. ZJ1691]|uniref:SDR family NAD(P)-dependent oxidoreductase n=1 Tax=Schaalia sp. ZJ1691 TaxID=2709404 RepID=UPI0013EC43C9|nr:SDR family oxidoreductase [Schaalia sp. ZJ1691]
MGTALVTGATSGLGEEFCWQLAAAGHNLVLVARRGELLAEIASRLHNVTGVRTEVIVADLAQPKDRARVGARIQSPEAPIGLLVNNAGFGLGRPFVDNSLENEKNALTVMVEAVMELSHCAARAMRERGHGAILNVASVASLTGAGTYSAHKAWVVAFTEGLSQELRGTPVTATAVCPGPTRTQFFDNAGVDMGQTPPWAMLTSEQVVSEALDAVSRGRVLVTPSPLYKVAMGAMKVSPRWLVRRAMRSVPHM